MMLKLKEFREECLKYPHLKDLWGQVAGIALNTQTRGLPLALRFYHGEPLSPQEETIFEELQHQFDAAAARLKKACNIHGIEMPEMEVGDVCALYS